jgi:hypothetical protein
MIDFKNIALGYLNSTKKWWGISSPEVEELAAKRYEICLGCPNISKEKTNCTLCTCKLWFKVRSGSK